mmetsp:Transcript_27503/g.66808  ORF Transcript_27503/g.66808 Transcript_27503/m.66808 type:complete len:359 (+) Transcript_27503:839-1915(+)
MDRLPRILYLSTNSFKWNINNKKRNITINNIILRHHHPHLTTTTKKETTTNTTTTSIDDESPSLVVSYSFDTASNANGSDVASLTSQQTGIGNTPSAALLKTYQEKLSKQLSELAKLCEQDNHVENLDDDDVHSTYTNPDNNNNNNSKRQSSKASSESDDEILHEHEEEEEEEDEEEYSSEALLHEEEEEYSSEPLQDTPTKPSTPTPTATDQRNSLLRRVPSSSSDLSSVSEGQPLQEESSSSDQENNEKEDASATAAPVSKSIMDRDLADMKTPKKSNLSSPKDDDDEDDDDNKDDLEDLYHQDGRKWGKADMKGEDDDDEVVEDEDNHVSITTQVALAAVAVVAGFCVRTFSRHR